jgi:hypothetical protein
VISEQALEARSVLLQQPLHALDELLASPRSQRPHRLVAEDRLQQLLADRGGAAGDQRLRARQPTGVREDGEHDRKPGAVDAE